MKNYLEGLIIYNSVFILFTNITTFQFSTGGCETLLKKLSKI
jgi:hypothetical protein